MNEFKNKLCDERHEKIDRDIEKMDKRVEKVENCFIVIMTVLIINLIGIVGQLLLQVAK